MSTSPVKVVWNGEPFATPVRLVAMAWNVADGQLVDPPEETVSAVAGANQRDISVDPDDGVHEDAIGPAVKGSLSVRQYLPRTKAWGQEITEDDAGDIVETPIAPLPLYQKRRHGNVRADGRVSLDITRYANRAGLGSATSTDIRMSWTDAGFVGGETYIPVPDGDVAVVYAAGSDNLWKPGMPLGLVTPEGVELLPFHADMPRIDLRAAFAATTVDAAVAAMTVNPEPMYGSTVSPAPHTQYIPAESGRTEDVLDPSALRVRIVRTLINDSATKNDQSVEGVVFDGTFDIDEHPYLTEADLAAYGKPDLDWNTLLAKWGPGSIAALYSVTYRIVFGGGSVAADETNNCFPVMFVNTFAGGAGQPKTTLLSPDGTATGDRPTFRWKHDDNSYHKIFPAFHLRIYTEESGGTKVYDTGAGTSTLPAPPRDSEGVYSFTLPAEAALEAGTYWWCVSMCDAKFTAPNSSETRKSFTVS